MHYIRKNKSGFTLIELLLVVSMLAIVSLSIYATFNNGIKIWQKINRTLPEEDLVILFDKFTSDLNNSLNFDSIKFLGTEGKVELATLVNSPRLQVRTVGKVIYSYDSEAETISREQRDFSHIHSNGEGPVTDTIKNVKFFKFKYYIYDLEKKQYLWQDEWLKEGLPLAVRIELEIEDGSQINKFTRTVSIPISG